MSSVAGLIYAGGQSTRFGGNKAAAILDGRRLIDHVAHRFRPQVASLAVAGTTPVSNAASLGDEDHGGKGPLAGLLAGFSWASTVADITWLATTPCDVPLLPTNLVGLLSEKLTDRPRVLCMDGQWQTGCALWPLASSDTIEKILISATDLSVHSALRTLDAEEVSIQPSALDGSFFNINTRQNLSELANNPTEHLR